MQYLIQHSEIETVGRLVHTYEMVDRLVDRLIDRLDAVAIHFGRSEIVDRFIERVNRFVETVDWFPQRLLLNGYKWLVYSN